MGVLLGCCPYLGLHCLIRKVTEQRTTISVRGVLALHITGSLHSDHALFSSMHGQYKNCVTFSKQTLGYAVLCDPDMKRRCDYTPKLLYHRQDANDGPL